MSHREPASLPPSRLQPASRQPWSDRVCDATCLLFALWTVCCHVVVVVGGALAQLLPLYAVALLLAGMLFVRLRREPGLPPREKEVTRPEHLRWKGALAGLALTAVFVWSGNIFLWWWLAVSLLGLSAILVLPAEPARITRPSSGRDLERLLWGMALVAVGVTLISHRYDLDDAFYVNLAVSVADDPHWALLSHETIHGFKDLPVHLPVYRAHSYELWNGALSYLTGIPAIYCFHWISAALAAALLPLAHAKLFRLLTPRNWLWAVAIFLFVLVSIGDHHRWYGNFSFVRMWQGKAIFLFVFLPLIYTYAIKFALGPSKRHWLLLASAQIAALGCTSSALWAGPVSAVLALVSAVRPRLRALQTLILGASASIYVLMVGWAVKISVLESGSDIFIKNTTSRGHSLKSAVTIVLGEGNLLFFGALALAISWTAGLPSLGLRFALVLPLGALVAFVNPYTESWVNHQLTGTTYWRILWIIPLPILMTFLLMVPLQLWGNRKLGVRLALCGLALVMFAWGIPERSQLSRENHGVRLRGPGLKVDPVPHRAAGVLNRSVGPAAQVVAPREVSAWVPTYHHHAYSLWVRHYLRKNWLDPKRAAELPKRRFMVGYVAGEVEFEGAHLVFRRGLNEFDIRGVCLRQESPYIEESRAILRGAGYRLVERDRAYEIWRRAEAPGFIFHDGFEYGESFSWSLIVDAN